MKHIPLDKDAPLVLRTTIDPLLEAVGQDKYRLKIYVALHNLSDIPAEGSLVLFPQLGIDIRPFPPMAIKETKSGPRKVLACAAHTGLLLAPEAHFEVCTILASYNRTSGKITFTSNDYHNVSGNLADFNILCATGASNFPLRQARLEVRSSDMRLVINSYFEQFAVSSDQAETGVDQVEGRDFALGFLHADLSEEERLFRLAQYQISRTPRETAFDDIVSLLAELLNTPIAFFCTTEVDSNWFKARVGIDVEELPRSISFCDYAAKVDGMMVIPDTTLDERFAVNPMVTGPRHIRFYAGLTLRDADGFAMGTLAAADVVPRQLSVKQRSSLAKLAQMTMDRMELRKSNIKLGQFAADAEAARVNAITGRAELRQVLECLPEAIVVMDSHDNLLLWNNNYVQMFPELAHVLKPGISYQSVMQHSIQNGDHYDEIAKTKEEDVLTKWLSQHANFGVSRDVHFADGRWIRFAQHETPDGKRICVRSDVTREKNATDSFRLLFENNPVPMWVVEKSTQRYIDVNSAALKHYGYTRDAFLKMTLVDIRPEREHDRILEDAKTKFGSDNGKQDWTHLKADGSEIIVSTYAKPISYLDRDAALVAAVDVTERRHAETRIQFLADHDTLTGLPNRRVFLELLERALPKKRRNDYFTAVIIVDVDNFKTVNDTLGHAAGDALIVSVAKRIEEIIGDIGAVARLGGDEFGILIPMLPARDEADIACRELIEGFTRPLSIPGREIVVGISAGMSLSINDLLTSSTLLMNADLALYQAKSDGRGVYRTYEPQMSLKLLMQSEMEEDLQNALAKNQFEVHYQPLMDLRTKIEIGFEALLRWKHPQKGMISPATFIPIAESSGKILRMGEWVLEQSCMFAANLRPDLTIAVNISPAQLKFGNLYETVCLALRKSGMQASRLELEITESSLLEENSEICNAVAKLKALGVRLVLDDFGTGYSGLRYLSNFPIDKIKIDRSFIRDLGIRPQANNLVRATINLGKSLGLTTLAEGIETQTQLETLQELGCQQGQGFLFSRAVPENEITNTLKFQNSEMTKRGRKGA